MNKGLEALEIIKRQMSVDDFPLLEHCRIIENKLKALEIIKKKRVNLEYLRFCTCLEDYNDIFIEKWQLTQEEYDSLREVML